jgi:hypothetical protein
VVCAGCSEGCQTGSGGGGTEACGSSCSGDGYDGKACGGTGSSTGTGTGDSYDGEARGGSGGKACDYGEGSQGASCSGWRTWTGLGEYFFECVSLLGGCRLWHDQGREVFDGAGGQGCGCTSLAREDLQLG